MVLWVMTHLVRRDSSLIHQLGRAETMKTRTTNGVRGRVGERHQGGAAEVAGFCHLGVPGPSEKRKVVVTSPVFFSADF